MKESDYTFRYADESDLEGIARLFKEHNYGPGDVEWLKWKFLDNPDGPATMQVAEDQNNKVVAFQAFLPRKFKSAETGVFSVVNCVDAFVADVKRDKGVYLGLSKYARKTFIFPRVAFPNQKSYRHALRDGYYKTIAPIEEWSFPLKIGNLLAGGPYAFLSGVANALSSIWAFLWLRKSPKNLHIQEVQRFERSFDMGDDVIHGIRSTDYLNWRFIDNPMQDYAVYEFLEDSNPIGYCAYKEAGSAAQLCDFVVTHNHRACIRLLLKNLKGKGISHLSCPGVGLHLGKFGFLRRGVVSHFVGHDVPEGTWMLTACDRDV